MSRFLDGRAAAAEPSIVAVAEGKDYGAITKRAVNAVGGIGRFVKAGNTVVIKPNMGSGPGGPSRRRQRTRRSSRP